VSLFWVAPVAREPYWLEPSSPAVGVSSSHSFFAESLKADPQLSNREHARRTGASHVTVSGVREELQESGQIDHFEKRADPRTGNMTQPASQPPRPVGCTIRGVHF